MTQPDDIPAAVFLANGGANAPPSDAAADCPAMLPYQCGSVQLMYAVEDVFLCSQPAPGDLVRARDAGVRTVLNVRDESELPWDERDLVEQLGMQYFNIPYTTPATLTDEVFDAFRRVATGTEHRPLLVHCRSATRLGPLWMAHRVLDAGVATQQAAAEAAALGMPAPALAQLAQAYVHRRA